MEKKLRFNSATIHGGQTPDPAYGAVMPPIYQTSTYAQTTPGGHKGFEYSRTHNPTRQALEKSLASIENGKHGLAFASGLAAMDAVMKLLQPGDEVISTNDLYGGSYRLFTKIFEDFGLKFHFVGMNDLANVEAAINKNTKLIWVETPTNPMMNVVDIEAVAQLAKKNNLLLAVDNTFASPYLQQPLKFWGRYSDALCDKISSRALRRCFRFSCCQRRRLARTPRFYTKCQWCCPWSYG